MVDPDRLLTLDEVALLLGLRRKYVSESLRLGRIPGGIKDNRQWLVPLSAVIAVKRSHRFWKAANACKRCGLIAPLVDGQCAVCREELAGGSVWYEVEPICAVGMNGRLRY